MKVLALFAALVAVATAASFADNVDMMVRHEWEAFKAKHGKSYNSYEEDKFHLDLFIENKIMIEKHNARYARGEVSYELEANEFTDLLNDEFLDMMNGYNRPARKGLVPFNLNPPTIQAVFPITNVSLPDKVDWREKGAVTPVKNQGGCGSCYAFSAMGALESQHFIKTGQLVSLSEQNIVDCSRNYGNNGCGGGWMVNCFNYVRDNHGVDKEATYPYTGRNNEPCRFDAKNVGATAVNSVSLPSKNEEALKQAVATIGPISVAIQATKSFTLYKTGVFHTDECDRSGNSLNHGVLAVGYGTENGNDYWLVKNSWGAGWGDRGYIKMARNRQNNCGISTAASYPIV